MSKDLDDLHGPSYAAAARREVDGPSAPTSGLEHYLYVHAHHALRALRGSAERHPEDEGIRAAQERLSALLAGLKVPVRERDLDAVKTCRFCGIQSLRGHTCSVGDDDSVSVDDVIGILAPAETDECDRWGCDGDHRYFSHDPATGTLIPWEEA